MEIKLFEIRDKGTFIPMMAIKLTPICEEERWLLSRAGFGRDIETQSEYIMLADLDGGEGKITSDCYKWGGRTYPNAHRYIQENFDKLKTGDVVDVEYILGEKGGIKISERFL
jgi:hypothetical protein